MAGKSDGDRDVDFWRDVHTPKSAGKSFLRVRSPAIHSNHSNSPKRRGSTGGTPATQAHRTALAASTPPMARAIPAKVSERVPQKFPVAPNSTLTTPSKHVTFAPRPDSRPSPGTMSSRKLDGVRSLGDFMEKMNKESSSASSRSKHALKAKAEADKKFDARAESDGDDSSSSDSDSDSDVPTDPDFIARINGQVASSPAKKTKRGKDDEVADSDNERKAKAAKSASTKKVVRPESSSEESSDEAEANDSDSDSSDSESEAIKPAQKVTKNATSNGTSSTSTSDSDSDSESETEKRKPAAKPTANGTKLAKPASTSSSGESSSESEDEAASESESGDKDSSSEESESEIAPSVAVANRRSSKDLSVPGFVAKDFVLRKAQGDEDGKDMVDLFAKAKSDGKQLWYFTAPASIPINVIEKLEIPMDKAKKGASIFKHNSDDYTVGFDGEGSTSIEVRIPNKNGTRYDQAPTKLDNVLHIKRVTQLAGGESRPTGGALTNEQNAVRPQPQGLRARFRPIGVTDDTPMGSIGVDASSDSDVEITAAPAASSSKKSKPSKSHDAMDIDEPTLKSSKKDKKKSKTACETVQDSQSTIIEVPNSQPISSKEKKSKKRRGSIESISSVGSNPKPELLKGQKGAVATPTQSKASKRKHSSEDDQEDASAQLAKETASAEKKTKKVKRDDSSDSQASKKETAIPPPTIPKANYSFSGLPGSSPAPTSTPQPSKSKSSKKAKETPVQPPSVRRESAVPLPQHLTQASPAVAEETPKKDKRKRRKSDKAEDPKSDKKETPIPVPGTKF